MKCPYCQHRDSRVVDSRTNDDDSAVRRRRECPECGRRFTTYERVGEVRLYVVKKDGRRESFDRSKVVSGMVKACEIRPVSHETIEQCADEIERYFRDELIEEMSTNQIGALVMDKLRALDGVAYVRFASVYKEFRDAHSFVREVEGLTRRSGRAAAGVKKQSANLFEDKEEKP
jgi:transcriptional repressor NrdR